MQQLLPGSMVCSLAKVVCNCSVIALLGERYEKFLLGIVHVCRSRSDHAKNVFSGAELGQSFLSLLNYGVVQDR